jgi:hypothetical protein
VPGPITCGSDFTGAERVLDSLLEATVEQLLAPPDYPA